MQDTGTYGAIAYIVGPDKTADRKYVVSNLCVSTPCGASEHFRNIRQTVGTGRSRSECQHIIQSFAPGEVTPERALLIGQELCKALFNDEYQYVLAVHVDHSHVHNHIIVNNVNFYTGRDFIRRMGLSANTFYRRVREYEAEHGIAEPTSA